MRQHVVVHVDGSWSAGNKRVPKHAGDHERPVHVRADAHRLHVARRVRRTGLEPVAVLQMGGVMVVDVSVGDRYLRLIH